MTEQSQQTFKQAIARVQPAARALISRLRALANAPDEVGWSGLELSAEAGAFVAVASSTAATFKVTLSWRRSSSATTATSADTADGV